VSTIIEVCEYGVNCHPSGDWDVGNLVQASHCLVVMYKFKYLLLGLYISLIDGVGEESDTFRTGTRSSYQGSDQRLAIYVISLTAVECGSTKRKCSVCVRHGIMGGRGHLGCL